MSENREKTHVLGKGIEVTPALRQHAERGTEHLSRLFHPDVELRVEVALSVVREVHVAEVTSFVEGLILRGESRTGDLYASIDDAFAKILRQAKRYKGRLASRQRGGRAPEKLAQIWAEVPADEVRPAPEPAIVRSKKLVLEPMDAREAAMQMELLGHDFFLFANAATGAVNVVYRRKDGAFGVIETLS